MAPASGLHATFALAFYSLFPPTAATVPLKALKTADTPPSYIINTTEIAATIATLDTFCDNDGALGLIFTDALAIAAPFLLFRLKRTGYSACRVTATECGLRLTARR
jgi:hypothetical protein